MEETKILVTITGPSLTGKSTLEQQLKQEGFSSIVSTTTRPMREGEINGVHYHFIDKKTFQEEIKKDAFIEHVEVNGHFYGVSKKEIDNAFKSGPLVAVVCEPNGVRQISKAAPEQGWTLMRIFLNNPQEVLMKRFLERFKGDHKATVDTYYKRLDHMINIEPEAWIEPALTGKDAYEMVEPMYTPENEADILTKILNKEPIASLRQQKKIKRRP